MSNNQIKITITDKGIDLNYDGGMSNDSFKRLHEVLDKCLVLMKEQNKLSEYVADDVVKRKDLFTALKESIEVQE